MPAPAISTGRGPRREIAKTGRRRRRPRCSRANRTRRASSPSGCDDDLRRLAAAVLPRHPDVIGRFQHSMHGEGAFERCAADCRGIGRQRQPARRTTFAVSYRLGATGKWNADEQRDAKRPSDGRLPQRARRRGARADRRRDPRRGRGRARGAGPRRDGDRAARASRCPDAGVQRPFQRAARLRRAARRSPASRSSATSSTTTSTACRRNWACSTCSIRAPARRVAIIDAAGITDMRTGAVTAIGAKYLARKDSRVLGHIGARGTAYWNVRLLDHLFDFDEIRVHSRRPESRDAFAAAARRATSASRSSRPTTGNRCVRGADIVVEASRLPQPEPLLKTEWIKPRRVRRALRHDERGRALAHRHHGQDRRRRLGPVQGAASSAALRAHVEAGKLSRATLHAELGEIVAGRKPGRESDDETILFWHRGLSLSDIALGRSDARQGEADGHRPAASLCLKRDCASRGSVGSPTRGCTARRSQRRPKRGGRCSRGSIAPRAASTSTSSTIPRRNRLPALWARPDLGCAFMCGYPFATCRAAPVAARGAGAEPAAYGGAARLLDGPRRRGRTAPSHDLDDASAQRIAFTTRGFAIRLSGAARSCSRRMRRRAARRSSRRPSVRW